MANRYEAGRPSDTLKAERVEALMKDPVFHVKELMQRARVLIGENYTDIAGKGSTNSEVAWERAFNIKALVENAQYEVFDALNEKLERKGWTAREISAADDTVRKEIETAQALRAK